jgi:hypothetical protein
MIHEAKEEGKTRDVIFCMYINVIHLFMIRRAANIDNMMSWRLLCKC